MKNLLSRAPKFLFFTGKGGVGKTSIASSTAVGLAEAGKRVLLISTDPASNLDEVFGQSFKSVPTPVKGIRMLDTMNINPMHAALEYREKMVGPYRGVLPQKAVDQMEEQLSGACTVEIAGFNEFSRYVADVSFNAEYDHIILDTAPTGHTLRLLNLPAAWNDFIAENKTGSSCLGPVSGLREQKKMYEKVVAALKNPLETLLVLVTRPEPMTLREAARAGKELRQIGLANQYLVINGLFRSDSSDTIAEAFADQAVVCLDNLPDELKFLERTIVGFRAAGVMGIEALRQVAREKEDSAQLIMSDQLVREQAKVVSGLESFEQFIGGIEASKKGVIMTMGKGGVGKTTMAALIAVQLAGKGHSVLLSTTDPAAHIFNVLGEESIENLSIERIDPVVETRRYVSSVLEKNRNKMTTEELTLLEEELRSPCIEEIAIFQAFAKTMAKGEEQFIVLDTAPTGHTLLLLDATQAYHREVAKSTDELPDDVKRLLPRVRDPDFTKIIIVALPEATPVHEASMLQQDLERAGISTFGWILNKSFSLSGTKDPVLCTKGYLELPYIQEVATSLSQRNLILPWIAGPLQGHENINRLMRVLTRHQRK